MRRAATICLGLLCLATPAMAQSTGGQGTGGQGTGPAAAPGTGAAAVGIARAWARASIGGSTTTAAYLSLTGRDPGEALVGASTPVATTAQLHTDGMEGGVMHMRAVDVLPLPPGRTVTLAPGGYHLMLEHLAHPLRRGDTFPLTLRFSHAAPVTVQVRVEGPGATQPDPMAGMDPAAMPGR